MSSHDPDETRPSDTPVGPAAPAWARGGDAVGRPWWDEHTRLVGPEGPAAADALVDSRSPGRHVATRAGTGGGPGRGGRGLDGMGWTPRVTWRDRLLLGPAQLAVVAVLVVVMVGITGWWLLRGRSSQADQVRTAPAASLVPVPAVATARAQAPTGAAPSSSVVPRASPRTVTVDVAGKVRHPGLQVLATGARVADAVSAAGGARAGVDLSALNLAQVLVDGQQVLVGRSPVSGVAAAAVGAGAPTTSSSSSSGPAGPAQLVDLNTATADQLDSLPEVGPVTAASILSWRDAHGGFTSVDELLEVNGIGEVTLGKIAPYVTV